VSRLDLFVGFRADVRQLTFCWGRCYFCLYRTVINLETGGGSFALILASIWTGIVHLALGVLGTFVLKRFPTSFSVGFLLGVLVVLSNQNLLLFATFSGYKQGSPGTNHAFAGLGLTLFAVLSFMSLLLVHFKHYVVVAPMGEDEEEYAQEGTPMTTNA
jgi:hypothetical protein